MKLAETVLSGEIPDKDALSPAEFEQLVWAFRGVVKEQVRERAFWAATNENLKSAFMRLADKERELEHAYAMIREDLAVANRIQESLLPNAAERMEEELEIAVFHRQLADVGGDYYDFFTPKDGGYAVGVFDISGHGVSAALVMTYLKAQFMTAMNELSSPGEIVASVNDVSLSFMRTVKKYAAASFVLFNGRSIRYVNGGGNGLLVGGAGAISFEKADQFLGLRPRLYHEHKLPFHKGDIIALYTDGIIEAQNEWGEDYTKERLNSLIVQNCDRSAGEILQICQEDYAEFRLQDSDDITLVLLRKKV